MANNTNNLPVPNTLLTDDGGGMSTFWYLYFAQQGLIVGTGVPASQVGSNGNYYFRKDGVASNHIYFKAAGAWSALI